MIKMLSQVYIFIVDIFGGWEQPNSGVGGSGRLFRICRVAWGRRGGLQISIFLLLISLLLILLFFFMLVNFLMLVVFFFDEND